MIDPIVEQNSDENTENLDNNQRCFVCELFISKAKSMMTDPNFEKDFKSMINDVCTNLPNDFRQHCVDYTKQYFDIGLALFKKFIASPHACVTIHLCPVSYSSDQAGKNFLFNLDQYSIYNEFSTF